MKYILPILIILLALSLRIYKIDSFPSGFYSDEAMFSYEAYSLGKNGKDQYGNFLPITLKAFGDYRPGLFSYVTIPFVKIFGLSETSARFPSAILSTMTIIILMLIADEIMSKKKIAFLAGFLFAVLPWDLQMARMSHETNIATLLITVGIYCLTKSLKRNIWLVPSIISFGFSIYAYYSTRLFSILFLSIIFLIYRKNIFRSFQVSVVSIFIIFLLFTPLVKIMTDPQTGWSRVNNVSLWGDKGILANTLQGRQEDILVNQPVSNIFHNKIINSGLYFLSSYLVHFEPKFLLFSGDPNKIYSTPDNGILLISLPILILIGLYYLIKDRNDFTFILFSWILIGLLPDALTRFAPATPRIHLIAPALSIIAAIGLYHIIKTIKLKINLTTMILLGSIYFITIFTFAFFLHSYFFHLPIRNAKEWQYGIKEIATYIKENRNSFSNIWISESAGSWIYYLFFLNYDPSKAQREVVLLGNDEYGMGKVYGFDKLMFKPIPAKFDLSQNIAYIGAPHDFAKGINTSLIVSYPNKEPAYYVVTTEDIKQFLMMQ